VRCRVGSFWFFLGCLVVCGVLVRCLGGCCNVAGCGVAYGVEELLCEAAAGCAVVVCGFAGGGVLAALSGCGWAWVVGHGLFADESLTMIRPVVGC